MDFSQGVHEAAPSELVQGTGINEAQFFDDPSFTDLERGIISIHERAHMSQSQYGNGGEGVAYGIQYALAAALGDKRLANEAVAQANKNSLSDDFRTSFAVGYFITSTVASIAMGKPNLALINEGPLHAELSNLTPQEARTLLADFTGPGPMPLG